jgi:hypothetical protein
VSFNNFSHKYIIFKEKFGKKPDLRVAVSNEKLNMVTIVSKIQAQVFY